MNELIEQINWELLREQKVTVVNLIDSLESPKQIGSLAGLLHLIDEIQDYAVDNLGISEKEVFDFPDDE